MRTHYWSHSKLANWLRKTGGAPEMPKAATSEEWIDYHKAASEHSPFLYWLADDALIGLQDFVYWPKDKLDSFSYWVYNRFIGKEWMIDTGLDRNIWHETDDKILHGMFSELTKYVEVQLAARNWEYQDKNKDFREKFPYFIRKMIPYNSWMAGVDHLIWETKLINDESMGYEKDHELYGELTFQAEKGLIVLELYVWWKYIRPMREDPMDASGYTEYFESIKKDNRDFLDFDCKSEDEKEWRDSCSNMCYAIEERYEEEDTEMLKKLIDIRRSLWT